MPTTSIDALAIVRALRDHDPGWGPALPFGPDGWAFRHADRRRSCIVTCATQPGGIDWLHASITAVTGVPDYDTLTMLHRAVWGSTGWAYQVFAPPSEHVNLHQNCLHLFGRLDGAAVLPDFTWATGSI